MSTLCLAFCVSLQGTSLSVVYLFWTYECLDSWQKASIGIKTFKLRAREYFQMSAK